jgi:hypothetical protein
MQFKGHNGKLPCRWCKVAGIPYIRTLPNAESVSGAVQHNAGTEAAEKSGSAGANRPSLIDRDENELSGEELSGEAQAGPDNNVRPTSNQKSKKPRTTTTYYVARLPDDIPTTLKDRNIQDIDYAHLTMRTDAEVKNNVNKIIEPGITKKERERRATDSGISGAVGRLRTNSRMVPLVDPFYLLMSFLVHSAFHRVD